VEYPFSGSGIVGLSCVDLQTDGRTNEASADGVNLGRRLSNKIVYAVDNINMARLSSHLTTGAVLDFFHHYDTRSLFQVHNWLKYLKMEFYLLSEIFVLDFIISW
jgi:hypothetical protein